MASEVEEDKGDERLINVRNDKCVLVQFINESSKSAVGYLCWLHDKDSKNIDTLIQSETNVTIEWPDNCPVIPTAQYMKRKKFITFSTHVVKVLAVGDWTDMQRKKNNLATYGQISPTKEERKILKSKNKAVIQQSTEKVAKEVVQDLSVVLQSVNTTDKSILEKMQDSQEDNNAQINYSLSDKSPEHSESEKDDDDDDESFQKTLYEQYIASTEEENNTLKQKIKDLEHELKMSELRYEHLDVEKKAIEVDFESYKEKVEQGNSKDSEHGDDAYEKTMRHTKKELSKISKITKDCLEWIDASSSKDPIPDSQEPARRNKSKKSSDVLSSDPDSNSSSEDDQSSKQPKKKKAKIDKKDKGRNHHSGQPRFSLRSTIINNLDKSSIESFTNDLLENVFTDEELAGHSVTGVICNASTSKECAPALDPERMNYIRETVYKFFGKTSRNKSRINKTTQNKIGSKRKDLGKKK